MRKQWNEYLWVASIVYLLLGFFNILFAWLGMICFITPIVMALVNKNKTYCHHYCGRGQLFAKVGSKFSRNQPMPRWMRATGFRYAFLIFFMTMFVIMVYGTYQVFQGVRDVREVITIFWTFRIPFSHSQIGGVAGWFAQYAFGFYSIMVTSTLLGMLTMVLYKPRSFCIYCPMGTMTQGICKLRAKQ
ncbi:MAG: 4Fe-4S binding protein [Erysipelotrichaceae bacterium]